MLRKRLAALAVVAGLGLLSGCASSNTSCSSCNGRSSFFSRMTGRTRVIEAAPVIESEAVPTFDGPSLSDSGPIIMPSTSPEFPASPCSPGLTPGLPPGLTPGGIPMGPPPRLVPEPQARVRPYNP